MGRVILNLLTNAFYAVTEKKRMLGDSYQPAVTISTRKVGKNAVIRVIDNGNGIPEKIIDKIFQPFFSSKPTGAGTGLGLSMCYEIVTKGHGGKIEVENKEGEGATMIVTIPT
jgi:signal transduction histidine kinase